MKKLFTLCAIFSIILGGCLSYGKKSGEFRYELSEEGAIIIDYSGEGREINFPEIIDIYNVIGINIPSRESSYYTQLVYRIIIPSTIKSISIGSFDRFNNLGEITVKGNADDILGFDSLCNSYNLRKVFFKYDIPRRTEDILYAFNNDKIILLTETSTWKQGYIDRKNDGGIKYSIMYNYERIASGGIYPPDFSIIRKYNDSIIYKISLRNSSFNTDIISEILFRDGKQISKEYKNINDIKYGTSDNIYYIGSSSLFSANELCRNFEIIGEKIREYCITADGLQYAFFKAEGQMIRGRKSQWITSAIFVNDKVYYHSPSNRSIFIQYINFHPKNNSIIYYFIDDTVEGLSTNYYLVIDSKIYGPYYFIKKESKISDDFKYFEFKYYKNGLTSDNYFEEKINL